MPLITWLARKRLTAQCIAWRARLLAGLMRMARWM
jgi:hypothetical protein